MSYPKGTRLKLSPKGRAFGIGVRKRDGRWGPVLPADLVRYTVIGTSRNPDCLRVVADDRKEPQTINRDFLERA